MKKIAIAALIGLIVAADAGLVIAYLKRGGAAQQSSQAGTAPQTQEEPHAVAQPGREADSTLWGQLRAEGDDARTFAAKLRKAGVPDRMARLLVGEALHEEYRTKQRVLVGPSDLATFWKSAASAADREKQTALRKLARDHEDLLTQLYGAGGMVAANRDRLVRLYGPLPDEKLERIDRIHADYGDMTDDIRARSGGLLLATDREMLALLDQECRKDVAAILTAEELERYDMLNSVTARTLRARLATFAPSETEFRALFRLQREFDERFALPSGAADDAAQRDRTAAEAALNARIKAALGDVRYAEYRRQQDTGYRVAARIAERFGLPLARAAEVCALSQAVQTKLQSLRADTTLTTATARETLAKLARETNDRLESLLGGDGAELYKQTSSGAWLRALERAAGEPEPKTEAAGAEKNAPSPAAAAVVAGQGSNGTAQP